MDDLWIRPGRGLAAGLLIPEPELAERFSRSSGPGGQSVNTTDSRVSLSWDIANSSVLTDTQRARLLQRLGSRLVNGVLTLHASEQRSQLQNRAEARERLAALVAEAMVPVTLRRATRPSRTAREKRLDAKKARGQTKTLRRRPEY